MTIQIDNMAVQIDDMISGTVQIVFVTDHFEDSICFEEAIEYQLAHREPSSPNIPTGVALWGTDDDDDPVHCGWVKESGRQPIDRCLEAGMVVRGKVLRRTNRWEEYCGLLEKRREWQQGEMLWWCYY